MNREGKRKPSIASPEGSLFPPFAKCVLFCSASTLASSHPLSQRDGCSLNFAAYKNGKRARERSKAGTSSRCDVVVVGGISFCEEEESATKMKRGEGVQEVGQKSDEGT